MVIIVCHLLIAISLLAMIPAYAMTLAANPRDGPTDNFVINRLVGKLLDRANTVWSSSHVDLDGATLGKPANLAIHVDYSPGVATRSLSMSRVPTSFLLGWRFRHVRGRPDGRSTNDQGGRVNAASDKTLRELYPDARWPNQIMNRSITDFEVDKSGRLVYTVFGYNPFPTPRGAEGTRIKIQVGPVGRRELRTFHFDSALGTDSSIFAVTMPRPLGIEFEEVSAGEVGVVGLIPKSNAWRQARTAQLNQNMFCVKEGDVLRGITTTNMEYGPKARLGAALPERIVVLFNCEGQAWYSVRQAMTAGLAADGDVTLVLERRNLGNR